MDCSDLRTVAISCCCCGNKWQHINRELMTNLSGWKDGLEKLVVYTSAVRATVLRQEGCSPPPSLLVCYFISSSTLDQKSGSVALFDPALLTVSMRIFFCSVAISFFSSSCAPWRKASWLFSMSSMFWGTTNKEICLIEFSWYVEITIIKFVSYPSLSGNMVRITLTKCSYSSRTILSFWF